MSALNRRAAELMGQFDAHACTDVTGFGLMGHLKSMAVASRVDIELLWDDVPLLPGVLELAAEGVIPGAVERNKESSADALAAVEGVAPAEIEILFDAQTSGGLLIALPESAAAGFVTRLHAEGIAEAAVVGRVVAEGTGRIVVRGEGRRQAARGSASIPTSHPTSHSQETNRMSCCEHEQRRRKCRGNSRPSSGRSTRRGGSARGRNGPWPSRFRCWPVAAPA